MQILCKQYCLLKCSCQKLSKCESYIHIWINKINCSQIIKWSLIKLFCIHEYKIIKLLMKLIIDPDWELQLPNSNQFWFYIFCLFILHEFYDISHKRIERLPAHCHLKKLKMSIKIFLFIRFSCIGIEGIDKFYNVFGNFNGNLF